MKTYYVYRHFDADGRLLYVGSSADPFKRLAQHVATSKWMLDVAVVTLEKHETVSAMVNAERAAVMAQNPANNINLMSKPGIISRRDAGKKLWKGRAMLDDVREALANKRGEELAQIAKAVKISYDTLLRIRDGRTDPAYSKVQRLAEHFRVVRR